MCRLLWGVNEELGSPPLFFVAFLVLFEFLSHIQVLLWYELNLIKIKQNPELEKANMSIA